MKSWYTIRARASGTEVLIYDEIGAYGVTARAFWQNWARCPMMPRLTCALTAPVVRSLMRWRSTTR